MDDETWLVWQLVDSALPTGGFVASGGLETAFQLGQVITSAQLDRFIRTSVHSYAHAALPFVTAAYHSTGLAILPPESLQPLVDADHLFHALNPHLSVRRASIAQGTSMITLFLNSDIAKRFKALIRVGTAYGHFPVCFGLTCRLLQLSLTKTQQLFLFMFVRQIVSSAIRLNIVGPYQAQVTLATAKGPTDEAIHMTADLTMDQATQTSPALDLLQGAHDRLYSRIFNS
ncbi:UreF-domain-containing protein [Dimargaris cristalligena]|uniref:UreF-domain-containing protein n=1 Tax=Dimargaris cristalligena TaxID=215637 RepID=A0A4P9ZU86_9FUNG|nr:UreF-domain-containing protein [Dimargaris cristalligena]|eukprot:RKP37114.1 UreF-domain-containing protein [Dimargaris cristalligena]